MDFVVFHFIFSWVNNQKKLHLFGSWSKNRVQLKTKAKSHATSSGIGHKPLVCRVTALSLGGVVCFVATVLLANY